MNSRTNKGKQPAPDSMFMQYELQGVDKKKESKIVVVNQDKADFSLLLIERLKERFGNDILIVTQNQAIANRILSSNIESEMLKISSRPIYKEYKYTFSGKEKRRERRLKERLNCQLRNTH
jgi:hypothetical protein